MTVPHKYAHILSPNAPRMIREAARLYGTVETPGAENNPTIMAWAREVETALGSRDLAHRTLGYTSDSIPWCGLFAGIVAVRAGWAKQMPRTPLWARSWLEFGQKATVPSFGDILVFKRDGGGGHVGFYVGEDDFAYHVLGGNQSDKVTISRIDKRRLLGARRPIWKVSPPKSVRRINLGMGGGISNNEA